MKFFVVDCFLSLFGLVSATCDISGIKVPGAGLPAQSSPTRYITYGTGSQNYTCGTDGKYLPAGVIARIFDISCTYNPATGSFRAQEQLGDHYYVTNPANTSELRPKWDFSRIQGLSTVAVGLNAIPSPTGPWDIEWMYFSNIEGQLAKEVYRTHTQGGQPPASCKPGTQDIAIWFTSLYWFTEPSML